MNSSHDSDFAEVTCSDPPEPAYNGGLRDWNSGLFAGGRTPYATEVTYTCGLGRRIFHYDADSKLTIMDEEKLKCQWSRTWEPEKVNLSLIIPGTSTCVT